MSTAETIIDDKSPICIPFILERYRSYSASTNPAAAVRPFIIGLNGVQGAGKTTLVKALSSKLRGGEGLQTLVCSIDDFYLRREDQQALAESRPDNLLVQVRGEPGTHDMNLARDFFTALCEGRPVKVPQYDKSAHAGRGDRVPESQWETVNGPGQPKVQVVIFEGWCVGFRPLDPTEVSRKWDAPSRTLRRHAVEHLNFVNDRLRDYDAITDMFDAFIHIDAQDTEWVYDWRLEQEAMLRRQRGTGMTDEQVVKFVDAYYPAYELFSDKMRNGLFPDKPKCQLRLIVGKDRKVKQTTVI
ncbi:P-loop containing nucleoside triphosphate hydrolase protein [Hypoxylon rubiginosum]|uniref:P-loop containing nucleoside triphosphate hydrolase protein n=1 Tax=Hypoxylon rubiginosum TaxID=110542 RepID=A0ACB9ZD40_9PEZI|nr:P-loop containing nucleoside triphosphate hydrolase protein [Hypoxylon rubiginosum]